MNDRDKICCAAKGPRGYLCTKWRDHDGAHVASVVAGGTGQVCETWEQPIPHSRKAFEDAAERAMKAAARKMADAILKGNHPAGDPPPPGILSPPPELPEGACTFCGGDGPCPVCRGTGERLSDDEVLRLRRKLKKARKRAKQAARKVADVERETPPEPPAGREEEAKKLMWTWAAASDGLGTEATWLLVRDEADRMFAPPPGLDAGLREECESVLQAHASRLSYLDPTNCDLRKRTHALLTRLESAPPAKPPSDACTGCEGSGEIHEPTTIPGDDGWAVCLVCAGSGKQPTNSDIADLRQRLIKAEEDVMVQQLEKMQAIERIREMEATPPPEPEPEERERLARIAHAKAVERWRIGSAYRYADWNELPEENREDWRHTAAAVAAEVRREQAAEVERLKDEIAGLKLREVFESDAEMIASLRQDLDHERRALAEARAEAAQARRQGFEEGREAAAGLAENFEPQWVRLDHGSGDYPSSFTPEHIAAAIRALAPPAADTSGDPAC